MHHHHLNYRYQPSPVSFIFGFLMVVLSIKVFFLFLPLLLPLLVIFALMSAFGHRGHFHHYSSQQHEWYAPEEKPKRKIKNDEIYDDVDYV